ncbi:hypothetical protein JB92DRAFT_3097429 [Gautieria morchelliformis]|nr:hypothetical protein JB92DRAFT_3097429 [Gautieria morchelliformis]
MTPLSYPLAPAFLLLAPALSSASARVSERASPGPRARSTLNAKRPSASSKCLNASSTFAVVVSSNTRYPTLDGSCPVHFGMPPLQVLPILNTACNESGLIISRAASQRFSPLLRASSIFLGDVWIQDSVCFQPLQ